jgi:hypothetical protein
MSRRNKASLKHIVAACISCGLVASCATTEEREDLGKDIDYRGSDCISIRTIRDYQPLDNRNLLVKAGGKRTYFVTLAVSSFEMRSSFRLGVDSRDSWLCPYGGDRIIFGGVSEMGISLRSISRVTEDQEEELLIRFGKIEPPELQDPAPPEVKGADVEELG